MPRMEFLDRHDYLSENGQETLFGEHVGSQRLKVVSHVALVCIRGDNEEALLVLESLHKLQSILAFSAHTHQLVLG